MMDRDHGDDTVALTPEEWERVKELVFSCEAIEPGARRQWLDEQCESERVRSEVERLLSTVPESSTFLNLPAPQRLGLGLAPAQPERVGRFKIVRQIGVGGMGVVYAAIDDRLGRQVALKVLHQDAAGQHEQRRRLLWDARAASALNHPNIVCVYEAGEEEGIEYVAMELVTGHTLADVLAKERPPQRQLLGYAVQIASALEAAHVAGIVHRDLKPANVMINSAGVAKLVDFGLAKNPAGRLNDGSAPITIEGQFAGTVAYMSPEQAEAGDIDFRSDVFSFGSVLYEMLTFQRAFSGASSVSVLANIIHTEPTPVTALRADVDSRLAEIVNRCLRKDRERRFQSMADVRILIEEVLDGTAPPSASSNRIRVAAGPVMAAAAIVIAALTGLAVYWRPRPPAPDPPAALVRLTWDGGLTTAPAISPDATLLAYASDRAGRGDLDVWVQRMGGSDPIRLTSNAADESRPTFSPDGALVAYRSERDGGGVYVVPSLGGSERLLVPGCRDPKYSPDGKWIACWTGDVGGAFYPGTSRIVIAASSGGQTRTFRPDFETAAFPMWTPDGKGLLFLGRKRVAAGGDSLVDWWIAPDGTTGEQATGALRALRSEGLYPPEGQFWIRPEAWRAGGRDVLFTARQKDATNVWAMAVAGQGDGARPRLLTRGAAVHAFPAAPSRPDDSSFVFASISVEVQLWQVPLLANAGHGDTPRRLLPSVTQIGSPSISSDGLKVVFSARQANGNRLVSVDTRTGEQTTVTTVESAEFVRTILSGDGRSLVYSANRMGFRIALRDGVPEEICARCGWPTHINSDGTEALFESAGADERLVLWSRAGLRPLIAGPAGTDLVQYAGRFSPDGRWVAFCAARRGSSGRQIVVVPKAPERALRQGEVIAVTDGTTMDREPFWSPDRRRLYFLSDRDGFRCIWARPMDSQTAQPTGPTYAVAHFHHARELLRGTAPSVGSIGLSASADSLIFTLAESSGNIWWQPAR
jgi:Tol biopolymer transport system component